jgi:hypothetical protein
LTVHRDDAPTGGLLIRSREVTAKRFEVFRKREKRRRRQEAAEIVYDCFVRQRWL